MEEPVVIPSAEDLFGILQVPDGTEHPEVAVVFVHGWSGYRAGPHDLYVHTARALAERGIASLRFDLRGRGDSGGAYDEADLDGMIADCLTAKQFVQERLGSKAIYLLGICSGGNVALGAASLDRTVTGLVLWSTPLFAPDKVAGEAKKRRRFFLFDYARKLFRRETYAKLFRGRIHFRIVWQVLRGKRETGSTNPKDSRRNVMQDFRTYGGRMLFVYGTRDVDSIGAPDFFRQYCEAEKIPADFATIEGANHSFYSVAWEQQVIEATGEWLTRSGSCGESGG